MTPMHPPPHGAPAAPVRCAIYTRKSTDEGLEKEFNSLDAQREAAQAFIRSQAHDGWTCLPQRYDDGGFTGGNVERPALQRLLADIEAGLIDCVVVYKVDRLSRSLLDFARLMATFEQHHVAFAAVTQQFNTATSMGRLVLNILLSFAQFERDLIAERTRDKIAATRRKGQWTGGRPRLGYDVDPRTKKLLVNRSEARRVRAIFRLYLAQQALLPVLAALQRRGWWTKRWLTSMGRACGGRSFTKSGLLDLLRNVLYVGRVKYKEETYAGEHPAIVPAKDWHAVQALLQRHGQGANGLTRSRSGALLAGLLHCAPCGCAMTPAYAVKKGGQRYRYYVCTRAQKYGWRHCPSKSLPAHEIEHFVVEQIRGLRGDSAPGSHDPGTLPQQSAAEQAPAEVDHLVRSLVARVDYDGSKNTVSIHLRPGAVPALAKQTTIPAGEKMP
jgi:site-specific DNA recombinase